ncbi:16144_t:CDS:2, partial [Racocetra persica]
NNVFLPVYGNNIFLSAHSNNISLPVHNNDDTSLSVHGNDRNDDSFKEKKYEEIEEASVFEIEETSMSNKTSGYMNAERLGLHFKEILNEAENLSTSGYTSSNEIIEVLDGFDIDTMYDIIDYEQLPDIIDASVDSEESDIIEVSLNEALENSDESDLTDVDMLEDMTSNFKDFSNKSGLYFQNYTSALIFIWVTKHMISTSAYKDLVKILKYSKYRNEDIPTNIWQIRKWKNRLLLAKILQHNVPLCTKRTPSTCKTTKYAFIISLLTYLKRILNNPVLMPKMYFGSGVVTNKKREFWYSEL